MSGNKKKLSAGHIIRRILIVVLFLTSFGMLLYPTVSTMWNKRYTKNLITEYDHHTRVVTQEDNRALWTVAREYNRQHTTNTIRSVFDENNEYVLTHPYDTLLDPVGNGVMGYIDIPKIGQKLLIRHGIGADALEDGVGHVEGTSLPIGGKGTHAGLAAHRGLRHARLFTDLDQLEEGDRFFIHVLDETFAYEVDQILVVLPDDTKPLDIEPDKDLVTLITCTPYGVNSHRLLVRGHRVEYREEVKQEEEQKAQTVDTTDVTLKALIASVAAMAFILLLLGIWSRRKK